MKTIKINGKDFHLLKDDKFYYCNKRYIQKRFISVDKTIFLTRDSGFNYIRIHTATPEGKAKDRTAELLNRDIYSYPCYDFDELSFENISTGIIKVNQTHYK